MGKVGRFACIFTPMALTLASLVCLLLVYVGGWNRSSQIQSDTYFFKADTTNFTLANTQDLIQGTDIDNKLLLQGLEKAKQDAHLADFYTVHLWNYCSGNSTTGAKITDYQKPDYCSPRHQYFWFNPVTVWSLNNTGVEQLFPKELNTALKAYQKVSWWMFVSYSAALYITIGTFLVGFLAIFSRWGSFLTTICATAAALMTLSASITATALFATLTGTFNSVLKDYGIRAVMGRQLFITTWLGAAFSVGAGFFWLISVCCCSGASSRGGKKTVTVEKTPYTYEQLHDPGYGAGGKRGRSGYNSGVPLQNMQPGQPGSAYEPFRRHDAV